MLIIIEKKMLKIPKFIHSIVMFPAFFILINVVIVLKLILSSHISLSMTSNIR